MSSSTAIGMVSESLRNLLIGEMKLDSDLHVTILAPDERDGDKRINLFLYKIQENPVLKNMDWQVKPDDPTRLAPAPLSLNLFYLMTPYADNDQVNGNASAHAILGEAMRVFYENPIVPQAYLSEGLQGAKEQIRIMLNTLDLEELSKVWTTFTQPFRLSVLYEVSVVQLDKLPESELIMATRLREIRAPDIKAQHNLPLVNDLEPKKGAPGSSITFYGENLAGWRAYITIMGRRALESQSLTQNSFQVTLPSDLPLGFHEIRIDVSHLFRRTFIFELINKDD